MAARRWPGRSAVGQTILTAGKDGRTMPVVGVVRDIKYYSLDEQPRPYVYFAADQADMRAQVVHVRTRGAECAAVLEIKRAASALNRRSSSIRRCRSRSFAGSRCRGAAP
jgi:hypothetical protein